MTIKHIIISSIVLYHAIFLFRLHENDTVHSLPTNTPANTNQHVTAPHFEINKNHAEFEYWDGPSSVAMMPIKSLRNETEDFQNVQRYVFYVIF